MTLYRCPICGDDVEADYDENGAGIGHNRCSHCGARVYEIEYLEPDSECESTWLVTGYGYQQVERLGAQQDTAHGPRVPVRTQAQAQRWVHPDLLWPSAYKASLAWDVAARAVEQGDYPTIEAALIGAREDEEI